jgi:hypothetical protein
VTTHVRILADARLDEDEGNENHEDPDEGTQTSVGGHGGAVYLALTRNFEALLDTQDGGAGPLKEDAGDGGRPGPRAQPEDKVEGVESWTRGR